MLMMASGNSWNTAVPRAITTLAQRVRRSSDTTLFHLVQSENKQLASSQGAFHIDLPNKCRLLCILLLLGDTIHLRIQGMFV